jgi:hypothetical protein
MPTAKSTKNAKAGTWKSVGFHPAGERLRLPNRLSLFAFSAFSAVKLFLMFQSALREPAKLDAANADGQAVAALYHPN